MTKKGTTYINRQGMTTHVPDQSPEEMERMMRESGLEALTRQADIKAAFNPMDLMQAMMSFQAMAGVRRFQSPPEDIMDDLGSGPDPDVSFEP